MASISSECGVFVLSFWSSATVPRKAWAVISALMGRALRHVADVLNNLDTGRNVPSYFIHSTNTSRTYHLTTCRWHAWGKSM